MRQRDWVMVACGGIAMLVATLVVGGAFRWTQAIVAVATAGTVASQVTSRRRLARISPLLALLGAAFVVTLLSIVPLPGSVRALLDPTGTALRADGAALLDLAPWPALSRDVPGSLRALIYFAILFGIGSVALRFAVSERGRYYLLAAVAMLCGITGLVTLGHVVVGANQLYGFYEQHASPNVLGPLLNQNHLGCLMAVGTCVSLGLLAYRRQRPVLRALWMTDVLLCGGMTAASGSRGALVALGVGGAVAIACFIGQRFTVGDAARIRRARFATTSLPIGIVGICVIVLVVYSSAGSVSAKFDATSLQEVQQPRSKFAAWKSSETLIRETPWVGVGRGGLEPSFARVHPTSGSLTFAFLENEYIQAIVDWGIPAAVVLAAILLWLAATIRKRWRDGPLAAGALGALLAVAIQSNVDYGIELLGLAIPVTVVAATVAYVPMRELAGRELVKARVARVAAALGLLGGAALLLASATRPLQEEHEVLLASPTIANVRAELERHPLDYFGYAMASQVTKDDGSIVFLNHAMRLHPVHPDLHRRAAALLLASGHPEQAAIEYGEAIRDSTEPDRMLAEIVAKFPPTTAALAIPFDYHNVDHMVGLLRELKHEDVATLWLSRVLSLHPRDIHACNLLYELSLDRGDLQAAEIAGRSCLDLMPDQQTRLSLAKLLAKRGRSAEVIRLLSDVSTWHGLKSELADAWLLLCDAHTALEHFDDAASCLHHLDASGDLPDDRHDEITKRIELIHDQRGANDTGSGH